MPNKGLTRRRFMAAAAAGAALAPVAWPRPGRADDAPALSDHEALAYEKLEGARVHCLLCPRECIVPDGGRGACGVRENQGGVYRSLVYARVCAAHVDPIEKKPLFHFLPGTGAFSIATAGCNVECQFCQNYQISQAMPESETLNPQMLPPDRVVELAQQARCATIAFTYSEPTVFYEYTLDTAAAAKAAGVHAVTISNGFIQAEPMERLCEVLSAVKIDLKAFTEDFYRRYVQGGRLQPVLDTIKLLHELGKHAELVTLLIPGLNDSEDEVRRMSRWVLETLGPDVPLHFTRFHPAYKMENLSSTPPATLVRAREVAVEEGIRYAYVGNLPGHEYESTFCHSCGKRVIERYGFYLGEVKLKDGRCEYCATELPGVWK